MPSKSSCHYSLHKFKGFHLKRLAKRKNQASTSSRVLNASTSSFHPNLQGSVEKESTAVAAEAAALYPRKYSSFTSKKEQESSKPCGVSHIKATSLKNLQQSLKTYSNSDQIKGSNISGTISKNSTKQIRNQTFRRLVHTHPNGEKALLIGNGDLVPGGAKGASVGGSILVKKIERHIKETEDQVVSLPNSLTIEAINYKCKILQLHNKKCGCSSPRLHIYLTTNHRCGEGCSIESYHSVDSISEKSSITNSVNRYIFTIMTGKSKAKRFTRKKANKYLTSSVSPRNVALQSKSKKRKNDEPESELLGDVCESLPTIMNTLSGDVEYIVLDDNTFNLSTSTKNAVSDDNVTSKISSAFEENDVKPDIQNLEQTSALAKDIGNWEDILERCLSEVSYQSSKNKSINHSKEINKVKTEPVEEDNTTRTTETSSLAGVCTNHCPSIKDIFGDVSVKDEPIDNVDANDMTVEDFSQEIKKLTDSEPKTSGSSKWPRNQVKPSQHEAPPTSKGLFAGLLKEETKAAAADDKKEIQEASAVSIKEENASNNDKDENNVFSSDDSLGPLQIDEGEQPPPEEEINTAPVAQPTTSIILPSVNIISPFKIKIFFGTPHRVQLEKPHELFGNSDNNKPVGGTSCNVQNGTAVEPKDQLNQGPIIDDEDSGSDTMQPLPTNESAIVPNLTCIYCHTFSPDVKALAKHFEDHQKEGLIICYFCQKSFGDKTGLKRHMRTHTGEKPYQCKVCGKRFSLPGNFKKHRDIHEDIRTEPCEICGKTFRRKEHLKYHMRTHTGEKPYTCTECGTSFTARYSLQIHMNIHLGKKPYKCTYCNKAFSDKSTMRKHVRVHTGEKPFNCEKCGRCFGESGTLAAHMATHRSDRPYKCKQCPLSFKTSGGLRQHEKIHTGEKLYACKYCGVRFLQKYNMTMHERIHTGEKPYSCTHCNRSFRSRSCLAKHIVLHGGEEERRYECEHCNSRFYRKAHLRRHIDMHLGIKNYECEICSKKFCARVTLENHQKTFHAQGARKFPCSWCGRVFKRQVYVNTHECIRDPEKVEQYKKEMKALALSKKASPDVQGNDNSSDTEHSSIDIKSEPEDDTFENEGLGEIDNVIGNANFDIQDDMIKQDPS